MVRNADGSQLVQVYSQKGELLYAQSINAAGTVTNNTKYYLFDGKAVLENTSAATTYLHTDALGSPVLPSSTPKARFLVPGAMDGHLNQALGCI